MKSSQTGIEPLCALAEELLDAGVPVDVVDLAIGEQAVARTDKTAVRTLLQGYCNGDLVLVLGEDSGLVALEIDTAQAGMEPFTTLWTKCPIGKPPVIGTAEGKTYLLMSFAGTPTSTRVDLEPGLALVANGEFIVVPPKDTSNQTLGWWKHFPSDIEIAPVPNKLAALL